MNNKTGFAITAIAVVAALLVTTSAMSTNNAFAGGHHYKKTTRTQALAQTNTCGNGFLPRTVDCQNAASQIQGKHNTASVAAAQPSGSDNNHGDNNHGDNNGRDNSGVGGMGKLGSILGGG